MKEERDIPDAEAAILQERFRDVLTHRVEDAGKRRVLLRKAAGSRAPADTERVRDAVGGRWAFTQRLDQKDDGPGL
jgi:hypothetical protein